MAKKGKARLWTEYLIARGIFGLLGILPRRAAVALGVGIGRLGNRLLGNTPGAAALADAGVTVFYDPANAGRAADATSVCGQTSGREGATIALP